MKRETNLQWICLRAEWCLSLAYGRWRRLEGPRVDYQVFCFACLLELSECKGHSDGTRVQNVQAAVSRTWCLLTRVHVCGALPDLLCIRFAASVKRTCNSLDLTCLFKDVFGQHPTACVWRLSKEWTWATSDCLVLSCSFSGPEVLVQSLHVSNIHDMAAC